MKEYRDSLERALLSILARAPIADKVLQLGGATLIAGPLLIGIWWLTSLWLGQDPGA